MSDDKVLTLGFHGRIIDHLGIQMYQSPTAAIAELISNSWDADATKVEITLPSSITADSEITISDDGNGMTFEQCQQRFLTVGFDKRSNNPLEKSVLKSRSLMGRKGIGKFAGFGIARQIEVSTTSRDTGEKTTFLLDLDTIRTSNTYISTEGLTIKPSVYLEPQEERAASCGTFITLKKLKLGRAIPIEQFRKSMARRFLLNQFLDDFIIDINGKRLTDEEDPSSIEFSFPKQYLPDEKPDHLDKVDSKGWGTERLSNGKIITWRINFYNDTIKEDDLQGIAIFAHSKLAQRPFMFNLTGGLPSQTAPEYMAGVVGADFIDELQEDIISTERQRLDWNNPDMVLLEAWGQDRIKQLLRIWKKRRSEEKFKVLNDFVDGFKERLDNLGFESATVRKALEKVASIPKISKEQFTQLGNAILTAWEGGRLKNLIAKMSQAEDMDEGQLLQIFVEANTIQALHTAESVKAKLEAITGLEKRIDARELENAVRDFIARHPWLISPEWETFAKEKRVQSIAEQAAIEAKKIVPIKDDDPFVGRVDLVLSSGKQLLVMEFMRPGLKVDLDHVNRFEAYINIIRDNIESITGLPFNDVTGYLIADVINTAGPAIVRKLKSLKDQNMFALTWKDLLAQAKKQWEEFFDHLVDRAPEDKRMLALKGTEKIASTE